MIKKNKKTEKKSNLHLKKGKYFYNCFIPKD